MGLFTSNIDRQRNNWRITISGEGGYCPCCERWGKISPQHMNEPRALALLWLSQARIDDNGWVDVPRYAPKWLLRAKNYTLLRHWGLIETAVNTDPKIKGSGKWRVTSKGWKFLSGNLAVPSKVFLYNNQAQGWSEEQVLFKDCFGRKFSYEEAMSDQFKWNSIKF